MTAPVHVLAAVRSIPHPAIPHPRQEPTMTAPSPAGLSPLLDQLDEARAGENLALPWHVDPYDGQRIATSLGGGVCSTYLPGDAALIVAAVNALPLLTAAVRGVLALADELDRDARTDRDTVLWVTDALRAALTAALTGEH